MKKILILLVISFCSMVMADAQTIRDYVRRGNRLMTDTIGGKDLSDKAIIQYKKALEIDSTFSVARYNLGNALLRQSKPQDAMKEYQAAAKYETDKHRLSDIYHNMGVLLQASKKYAEAVECYKESLRNDPSDNETRYNYVLAKWHLKNQNQQDGEDQNQKDQQQDQKQQEQKKQEKQDKKDEKQQESQPKQDEMSKENAERLLQAAMRNEKETQEKIQRQQQEAPRRRLQKQW